MGYVSSQEGTYLEDPGMFMSPFRTGFFAIHHQLGGVQLHLVAGDGADLGGHVHVTCPRSFDVGNPCIIQPLDQVGGGAKS